VKLGKALASGPPALLNSTLCHEVAHVAVADLFPGSTKPHGKEWAALVKAAGFEPQVRALRAEAPATPVRPARPARLYCHRCPVCQAWRLARRPVKRWRCAACVAAELPGQLDILPWPGARQR
jgi:predicted SprT family Zn-dependent metalloprotease